ncbi:MAG: hypothetical protein HQ534_11345 [Armatimonadetes bacterium]|nr:hypothetical protein [Armatimonadota bacterium]
MKVTKTEYLELLAEFNKNYNVSGLDGYYFGRIEIHIVDGKVNNYKVDENIRQKGLEKMKVKTIANALGKIPK